MNNQAQALRDHSKFQGMPVKIKEWILASPHATDVFSEFFDKGGFIDPRPEVKLGSYSPEPRPKIRLNEAQWEALRQKDASDYPQRHLFGLLAHEIGHDRYNTGVVPFTGKTEEAYVEYRASLEGRAIFNAFEIFKDLEQHPDFRKELPFNSIGYLQGFELAPMYQQWRKGELDDQAVVQAIAAKVPDKPYNVDGLLPDQNGDGVLTHRDFYLRDFRESQQRRLQSPNPSGAIDTPAAEPPRPAQGSHAPPGPAVTPDFRHPHHPLHGRYGQALDAVDALEEARGIPHTDKSECLAAAIIGAAQPVPKFQVGHLELVAGTVTVHSRRDNFQDQPLSVRVDTNQALALTPEQHTAAWQAQAVPGSQPTVALARLPIYPPDQLPAQDLRHPQHPRHALYTQAGEALAASRAQLGLAYTPEQLEREALGLAVASRQNRLDAIDGVKLAPDAQGKYGAGSNLMVYRGDPDLVGTPRALVPAAALQAPTERSVAEFAQVDLAVQLAQQEQQRRQQERQAQAPQGPVMG